MNRVILATKIEYRVLLRSACDQNSLFFSKFSKRLITTIVMTIKFQDDYFKYFLFYCYITRILLLK